MSRWWLVTDDYPPTTGGVAVWTRLLAEALVARGHRVGVLARSRPGLAVGTSSSGALTVRGVRGPSFSRWGGVWAALALASRVRRGDRVLATTWPVAASLVLGQHAAGYAVDVVAHGSDITRPALSPRARDRVLRSARWWAVSAFLAERVRSLGAPCTPLPSPIDPAPPSPPDPRPRWVVHGRATDLKGGDRAIRLAAAAGVRLDVIGEGPALAGWRALAASLGADVHFTGWLPHDRARARLAGAHLALLLPRPDDGGGGAEGLGMALIEAAAAGVPAVGSAVGGVPEAVGPGLILPDPDNIDDALARIEGWLHPDRAASARAWHAAHHGSSRLLDALGA